MDVIWDDTQKSTQAVDEMYNSDMFNEQQLMEWEEKTETDKTCTNCKTFFKKFYQLKKRYSNARPGKHWSESAVNVSEWEHTNNYEAIEYLERPHDSEQINQMATATNTMVEICQQLTEAKVEQGNQITILITKMDELTKMVEKLKPAEGARTPNNDNNEFPSVQEGK